MAQEHERLSVREKAGYGIGDAAANFIFQTMLVFQLAFYTDTFGITAAAAGTLFLVVRVWDAIFDPMMGVIADRTNTRWGKFRPWILWTAVPFGIMGFLTFTTPPFGADGKLIYAYVTYIVLMMVYSANNLPYSALSGVITGDVGRAHEPVVVPLRVRDGAAFVIQGLALPMVETSSAAATARRATGHDGDLLGARRRVLRHHVRHDARTRAARSGAEELHHARTSPTSLTQRPVDGDVRADDRPLHHARACAAA